ncbi:response regulator [Pleionea sediminis]|uniref:response regulator n=1 Tax=Pleionea sediminis TaxID=2569479 RepID=UPI0011866566|nr:response regulator [Pleionea sediminis]
MSTVKALIVDDSRSACLMLNRMLARYEIKSESVYSAAEAFEYLKKQRPDVIFMDHSMPDMDGLEAVKKIKEEATWRDIPIYMFTAKAGNDYLKAASDAGVVEVIPKALNSRLLGLALSRAKLIEPVPKPQEPVELTAEQKMQVWLESVIENKLAPALTYRVDKSTREMREETEQTSNRLYRESLKFHMRQQQQLVQRIQAERDFLSAAYKDSHSGLFKKIAATLSVFLLVSLAFFINLWQQNSELNESLEKQMTEIQNLKSQLGQRQSAISSKAPPKSAPKKRSTSESQFVVDLQGNVIAEIVDLSMDGSRALAKTRENFIFHINDGKRVEVYQGDRYFASQNCFGDSWIPALAGEVYADQENRIWYTPKDIDPEMIAVFSLMTAEGKCNEAQGQLELVQLRPNDVQITGIESPFVRLAEGERARR